MANEMPVIETIKSRFGQTHQPIEIALHGGGSFKASLTDEGIEVDNLGNQPLLPWTVFEQAIQLLEENGGRAERGNAMSYKLGEEGLPLNSVEGQIAYIVYRKNIGDSIFRRISPIAAILVWSGLCEEAPGELILIKQNRDSVKP